MKLKSIIMTGLVATTISCHAEPVKKETKQPNILYIFADQYRKASLGFLNEDPVKTPNIDALAENGVFFSHAVANHPLCSPYRGMLMTGQYPLTNGVISNCHSGRTKYKNYLKIDTKCFSDVLAENGYDAGYVGKWHLDGPEPTPPGVRANWDCWCPPDHRHGFSFWYAYGTHGRHNNPYYWTTNGGENDKVFANEWSPTHEASVIIDFLRNNKKQRNNDKPFALFWGINPPHTPFGEVPQKYKDQFAGMDMKAALNRPNVRYTTNNELHAGDKGVERKIHEATNYFACINGVDDQIGRVIKELKRLGMFENTIIVFSADHGEMMGSHGLMHKNIWFKEAYEIPFIVHYPKTVKPAVDDLLISVPDYMPTLLGLAGLSKQIPRSVEGKDYSQVLKGGNVDRPDKQLYFGSDPKDPSSGKRGFRNHKYTFAALKEKNGTISYYLYDDVNDPYQLKNIYGKDKKRDVQMRNELENLLKKMNDPWIN
ncbi:sulfatase [Prolixibacteraceae bacterium JC049]|nr:sulfatase [Prolixibacteraceae bacterium JC049]